MFAEEFTSTDQHFSAYWIDDRDFICMMRGLDRESIKFFEFVNLNAVRPVLLRPAVEHSRSRNEGVRLCRIVDFFHGDRLSDLTLARVMPFGALWRSKCKLLNSVRGPTAGK